MMGIHPHARRDFYDPGKSYPQAWGAERVNHEQIATEALRYRLELVRGPLVSIDDLDLDQMAGATVASAEPAVDSAIRRIATAWIRAGLPAEGLCRPWGCPEARALFDANPDLIDALDDIMRVATRSNAA